MLRQSNARLKPHAELVHRQRPHRVGLQLLLLSVLRMLEVYWVHLTLRGLDFGIKVGLLEAHWATQSSQDLWNPVNGKGLHIFILS